MLEEALLEPVARWLRFRQALQDLSRSKPITLVDLGCGPQLYFYQFGLKNRLLYKKYIAIDPLIKKNNAFGKEVVTLSVPLHKEIPLGDNIADYIVSFAFLEHIDHPSDILNDSLRILKKGGVAIFTTPSPRAQKLLEVLSFKLGLISEREIREHKNYFTKEYLFRLLRKEWQDRIVCKHRYFEAGMNNYFVITKTS